MAEVVAILAGAACSFLGALVLLNVAWRLSSTLIRWLCSAVAVRVELEEPDEAAAPLLGDSGPRTCQRYVYCCLEGKSGTGRALRGILLVLIVASVGCFVLSTRLEISPLEHRVIDAVEAFTVLFFSFEFLLRFWVCPESMPDPARCCVRLRWLLSDFYAVTDLASLVPFYLDLWMPGQFSMNLRLLRALRAMQLLEDAGAGIETFAKIIGSKGQVLAASSFFGASVWLVCSSLYYYFDEGNPAMVLCPLCSDPGDPESCKGKEQQESCYGRMDSIPSAMYFCLVNLFGEFPLMMEHSVGGKCVGVFIAIVGNAMAGIAMGVIGNGFADYVKEQKGEQQPEDDGDVVEGISFYSALPDGGSSPPAPRGVDLLVALDRQHGLWAKACCGLALVGWVEVLLAGHAEASGGESVEGGALDLGEWGDLAVSLHKPFEAVSAVLLGAEYAMRLAFARRACGPCSTYPSSGLGLVDLLAFAPALLPPLVPSAWSCWIWPLVSLARTLKLERYIGAFGALRRVIAQAAPILTTTGVVAVVLWLLFASLMWLAELSNPLAEMRGYYESIPRAMWITVLNLSGECPLADYTIPGKLITGFIGVFAVSIFSIPFGLMSDGFQESLDDDNDGPDEDEEEKEAEPDSQTDEVLQQQLHGYQCRAAQLMNPGPAAVANVLRGSQDPDCGSCAATFEKVSISMIFASVGLTLLESTIGFSEKEAAEVPLWLQTAELVVVVWFTFEFLLRFYAAPAEAQHLSRRRYLLSFCGIIDMLSVFPYWLSKFAGSDSILGHLGSIADLHDEEFRLCRLLRLLLLSNYVPSLGLIMRVLQDTRIQKDLSVALYVTATCWLFFATLLHLAEAGDDQHPEMAHRFRSVLSAMPFTLIHLTGDYPLVDYTVVARLVHVVMLVTAQGLVGVAGGIIASGFTRELKEYRAHERERRRNATKVLGRCVRYWLFRRRWMKLHKALKEQAQRSQEAVAQAKERSSLMFRVMRLVHGHTTIRVRMAIIILNVASVLAGSVPEIREAVGQDVFARFERGCVVLFSLDYLLKLYSAPVVADYGFQRSGYAQGFFGIVDLIMLLPYWSHFALGLCGVHYGLMLVRSLQCMRVLQLEEYVQAFTLLDDAWCNCKDTVKTSALIAFMIWLFGAVLFFELERGNEAIEGALDSIPSAMHFTAIFLGGEWAVVDFTPLGKVLCVLYCLLGIAVFAIPVGSFFEAFEAAITGDDE